MNKLLLTGVVAALLATGVSSLIPVRAPAAGDALPALAWLAGEWRGTVGEAEVVSWHSDPAGGMIVMASKEVKGGHASLFDFGVISERGDQVGYVPYPYGKPSVAFLLTGFDPAVRRAEFVNEVHDFPQRFVFELTAEGRLRITLTGDQDGHAAQMSYELARVAAGDPAR